VFIHFRTNSLTYESTLTQTREDLQTQYHYPQFSFSFQLPIYVLSRQIGRYQFPSSLTIPPSELSEWYENDGVCPVISQRHPRPCASGYCFHHQGLPPVDGSGKAKPRTGVWEVWEIKEADHFSLVPTWKGTEMQQRFYEGYRKHLDNIDDLIHDGSVKTSKHETG